MCVRVFSVGFGPGLDSMSPARSRRSASHAAGTHGRLPQKTGRPGLRRGGVGGYNLHSVPPNSPPDCGTVAHQPRAGCIRLVRSSAFNSRFHTFLHPFLVTFAHHMFLPYQPINSNAGCNRLNSNHPSQFLICPSVFPGDTTLPS